MIDLRFESKNGLSLVAKTNQVATIKKRAPSFFWLASIDNPLMMNKIASALIEYVTS